MNHVDFSNLVYYKGTAKKETRTFKVDLCIYGGSSAGVAAAIQADRLGLSVAIAEFGQKLGGLTAGGLGATDFGNKHTVGGISLEFYQELGKEYGSDMEDGSAWTMEPHVAENIYNRWIEQSNIQVNFNQHLSSVTKANGKITSMTMEDGTTYEAKMFMDATYEGDLFAKAGVSYHVGRESNDVYKETRNGIQFSSPHHMFNASVDPYVIPGKPDSGLLMGIMDVEPGITGEGDSSIQAYNFRICLTDREDVRVDFPAPPNYNPKQFELLLRYIQAGVWDALRLHKMMPRGKTDLNNFGGVSTDHIGANHEWPTGSYETRERIFQDHVHYNLGMLYFLSNDDRVPEAIRQEVRKWGLPSDEFVDTAHWPHHLYIREGRRMISDVVMNENHCRRFIVAEDPVGIASYGIDSHNCRRLVLQGQCINEGNVEIPVQKPFEISYRSIIPKGDECTNLLVPVCLSASHIAFGSIRMEPVFMILGQSAAMAGAIALKHDIAVQDVDYEELKKELLAAGQKLHVV